MRGKTVHGPHQWDCVWKDNKTGEIKRFPAQGIQGGQIYAQLFIAPDGETFALWNHITQYWPDKSHTHSHDVLDENETLTDAAKIPVRPFLGSDRPPKNSKPWRESYQPSLDPVRTPGTYEIVSATEAWPIESAPRLRPLEHGDVRLILLFNSEGVYSAAAGKTAGYGRSGQSRHHQTVPALVEASADQR